MIDLAYAQTGGAGAQSGGFSMLVPLLLMFAVFYFLLIRPQQKKQRKHQDMLKSLKVGDRIITSGGLCGTIVEGGEHFIKLEIADKIRVDVGRGYIAGPVREVKTGDVASGSEGRSSQDSAPGLGGFLSKLFKK
jgi:preprotein translocase subunit YajC